MTNPKLCPTCHTKISLNENTPASELKRTRGEEGMDSDGNPVPFWSFDPVLTDNTEPLNGTDFNGNQQPSATEYTEIQDVRKQQEIDLGINPPTKFTTISENFAPRASHLIELRISTERILNSIGVELKDYFKLDDDGNEQPAGPSDTQDKVDWTDVKRGNPIYLIAPGNESILVNNNTQFKVNDTEIKDIPGFSTEQAIRGIHLEDLRHPIPTAVWLELFSTYIVSYTHEILVYGPTSPVGFGPPPLGQATATNVITAPQSYGYGADLLFGPNDLDTQTGVEIYSAVEDIKYRHPSFPDDGVVYSHGKNIVVSSPSGITETSKKVTITQTVTHHNQPIADLSAHFRADCQLIINELDNGFFQFPQNNDPINPLSITGKLIKITPNKKLEFYFDYLFNGSTVGDVETIDKGTYIDINQGAEIHLALDFYQVISQNPLVLAGRSNKLQLHFFLSNNFNHSVGEYRKDTQADITNNFTGIPLNGLIMDTNTTVGDIFFGKNRMILPLTVASGFVGSSNTFAIIPRLFMLASAPGLDAKPFVPGFPLDITFQLTLNGIRIK